MRHRSFKTAAAILVAAALAVAAGTSARGAHAVLPPGNAAQQWDKIAEDTVVASGAFQNEGLIYMAYATSAMYNSVSAERKGRSNEAAVIESAYQVLVHYFPAQSTALGAAHAEALAAIPSGSAKDLGIQDGAAAAAKLIAERAGDGLVTPITSTSTFPTRVPGPGVWRLTPSAYAMPQTPWVGSVKPFVKNVFGQFLPPPPPSLSSAEWVAAFNESKVHGASTNPDAGEKSTAFFWTANVIRQYNTLVRDIATAKGLGTVPTARLAAMVNTIGADAQIAVMKAKYHYLFWRPVTAIDPTSVRPSGDGFGPAPTGFDDGNAATVEQAGWRPLIATPNHPEYPAAHGSLTGAESNVLTAFLGTDAINVDIHGFDPAGPAGNLNAVRHFSTAAALRTEIVNARVWGGMHYRFSGEAGVKLGTAVAKYDLSRAFLAKSAKAK
jgi:hypothetical protein